MDELSNLKNEKFLLNGSRLFSPDGLAPSKGEASVRSTEFWFRVTIGLTSGIVFLGVLLW